MLLLQPALAACGGRSGDSAEATTTTAEQTTSTTVEPTTTTVEAVRLDVTAVQYLGLFNSQLPLVAPEGIDLRLDDIAQGVFGGPVYLGTTVLVFADTPASSVTAIAVVVDLNIASGTPAKLISASAIGLTQEPAAVVEAFLETVVPELSVVSQGRKVYPLGELDLILTVSGQVLTFTYVRAGGDLPPFLN